MRIEGDQLKKDLRQRLWLVGNDLRTLMGNRAPVDTGTLKGSINFEVQENGDITFTMVDYGIHVEYGTKPHKGTNHPGTRAQPFIRPSLHQLTKIIKKRFDGAEIHVKV